MLNHSAAKGCRHTSIFLAIPLLHRPYAICTVYMSKNTLVIVMQQH